MRAVLAALLLVLAAPFAHAECAGPVVTMRQANVKYRAALGELRLLARDLGPVGSRSEEAVLRSLRNYTLVLRSLREQRTQIIGLYRNLVALDCTPFDQQGLQATVDEFRSTTAAEELVLVEARRVMTTTAAFP